MQKPEIPSNESDRLRALQSLNILDTDFEERFDRLTRLCQAAFGTGIVLVTLVDEQRQWFKASRGLNVRETGRDISFCGHAILSDEILEIHDARQDHRFSDNPLVTGPPYIRFYAGAPLHTQGQRVGTLCLIDSQPRELTPDERKTLRDYADTVEAELNRVTEQQLHRKLSEQRDFLESIFASNIVAITATNDQGQLLYANEQAQAVLGLVARRVDTESVTYDDPRWSIESLDGSPFPEDQLPFAMVRRTGRPVSDVRHAIVWPDGTRKALSINGAPMKNSRDGSVHYVFAIHDITHEMESQVSLSRQLWALEGLNTIAADRSLSVDDQMQQVLALGAEYLGLDIGIISHIKGSRYGVRYCFVPEGIDLEPGQTFALGDTYCDLVLQTDEVLAIQTMANSEHRGHPCYASFGLESYIGVSFQAGSLGEGTVNFSSATPRSRPFDASEKLFVRLLADWVAKALERERALQVIQLSESRLRALFELSPIGIALNDFETGAFVDVNAALLAPTGYTRDEFMRLSYFDVTPSEYMDREMAQLESLRQTGRYGPFEKEYIRKDGSRYPVRLIGTQVEDTEGRRLIWSIIEDISERRRIEQMKNEFISTVSHELRTPLTSIAGSLSIVTSGAAGELPDSVQNMLNIGHSNSQRLILLINDLLDMEKLVSGKMQFNLQMQPLVPIIEDAVRDNQVYADQFGVTFSLLPPGFDPVVSVDANRLQQVVANLLSNAAKFSPGGAEVLLEIGVSEGWARVTVHDRGPGIPASFHDLLFEKFSQFDTSDQRSRRGTGLGLAISKELMEKMGGRIGFHSIEGQGSSFWLELPLPPGQA